MTARYDRPILIMAGGTGGHVFPALAVAEYLRGQGVDVCWLGTHRGLEATLVPRAGIEIGYISIGGLRGTGWLGWALAPFRLVRALRQSRQLLRKYNPAAVLGMGGFVTGPGGVAGRMAGCPVLIHEQNAIAGMTNRWLARIASVVMEAFPATFPRRCRALHTGNPVRGAVLDLPAPRERFAGRGDSPLRLLVIGGSLGARALNETLPQALALLPQGSRPEVRHQSGIKLIDAARAAYQAAGVQAEVVPFIDDMAAAYCWADLVVCRAGAMTVSELACAGVASVLVPYPYAVDDHQTSNAEFLAHSGAALLVQQAELTPQWLADMIAGLGTPAQARRKLLEMAEFARVLAMPHATETVARKCMEVAYG